MPIKDETVIIVDERNQPVDMVSRQRMREANLIHRATYVLVFNEAGELFVHQRTLSKEIYPGYYDVAAGGVVVAGESYDESARRELFEELGLAGVPLRRHFEFFRDDAHCRVWGAAYSCLWEGPFFLQPEEVVCGEFRSVDRILQEHRRGQYLYTPDGIYVLKRYLQSAPPSSTSSASSQNVLLATTGFHE